MAIKQVKQIQPLMLVGVHDGGYRGEPGKPHQMELDYRAIEYLEDPEKHLSEKLVHKKHFQAHEKFFTETVSELAKRRYGATSDRSSCGIFGASNGAAFAVSMGKRHPDKFGFVFSFSLAGKIPDLAQWDAKEIPKHYLVAGKLEPRFLALTKGYAEKLEQAGHPHLFKERVSGHDSVMWDE